MAIPPVVKLLVPYSEDDHRLPGIFGSNITGQHEEIMNGFSALILCE